MTYTEEQVNELILALFFYADPETYHAIGFWPDKPCGEFMEDFSEDHGDDFYDRPMPGKRAREVLTKFNLENMDEIRDSDN